MNAVLILSLAFVALVASAEIEPKTPVPIVSRSVESDESGKYSFEYETANGIVVQESGSRKNIGTEQEASVVQGSYHYTAPDGTPITVTYTADENGFHPTGSHLPVPPPIPPLIQRALDWIAAHPQPQNDAQRS